MLQNCQMRVFWWKVRPILDLIDTKTKYNRDKPFLSGKRKGSLRSSWGIK